MWLLPLLYIEARLETEQTAEAELAQGSASGGDLRPDSREAEGESRPCYFPKASSLVHGIFVNDLHFFITI